LEDDLDISRGDMIVREKNLPASAEIIESHLVWMDSTPLALGKSYLVKHTTRTVRGAVEEVTYRLDPEDLHRKPAGTLHLNEIGRVTLRLTTPVFADTYEHNRHTGCFILIDPVTYHTAAAGVITRCRCQDEDRPARPATAAETCWVVGQPGAGRELYESKTAGGYTCIYLNEALLRQGICSDLKGPEQKSAWLERVAHVCRAVNNSGVPVIIESAYSPDDAAVALIGKKNLTVTGAPDHSR
ncbi:MAG: sulfate adenylyltransferase subunit CysN, partial [Methanoregula sp.]